MTSSNSIWYNVLGGICARTGDYNTKDSESKGHTQKKFKKVIFSKKLKIYNRGVVKNTWVKSMDIRNHEYNVKVQDLYKGLKCHTETWKNHCLTLRWCSLLLHRIMFNSHRLTSTTDQLHSPQSSHIVTTVTGNVNWTYMFTSSLALLSCPQVSLRHSKSNVQRVPDSQNTWKAADVIHPI